MYTFFDGDVIVHYQAHYVNAIYTRMDERWWRSPVMNPGNDGDDREWGDFLDQGIVDGCGYVWVTNVINTSAVRLSSR